jgi:hypothetical protein
LKREAQQTLISSFRATLILLSGLRSRVPNAADHRESAHEDCPDTFQR